MGLIKPRYRAVMRYLGWADPIYKWRLRLSCCPNCEGKLFLSLRNDAFMTRCMGCLANCTNLALINVLADHCRQYQVKSAYEMSSYGAACEYLKRNIPAVTTSEYMPTEPLGSTINGVLNQDVQKLTFGDATFDVITSNQVFEHVPDDVAGFAECHRVLRSSGALIFTVPLYQIPATVRLASLDDRKGVTFHGVPEYHDSRFDGARSVLTFWRHSIHDICARVSGAGFRTTLIDASIARTRSQVVYALKC